MLGQAPASRRVARAAATRAATRDGPLNTCACPNKAICIAFSHIQIFKERARGDYDIARSRLARTCADHPKSEAAQNPESHLSLSEHRLELR